MRTRNKIALVLVALLAFTVAICAIVVLTRDQPRVLLEGTVVLRDSYILSSCKLPTGEYCIWSYDYKSNQFAIQARRNESLRVFSGSTRDRITWQQPIESYTAAIRMFFTLGSNYTEPTRLDVATITGLPIDTPNSLVYVEQAKDNSDTLWVSPIGSTPEAANQLILVDIPTASERGRISMQDMTFESPCFMGPNREYIVFCVDNPNRKSDIVVFDSKTFHELTRYTTMLGQFVSLAPVEPLDFYLQQVDGAFARGRLLVNGQDIQLQVDDAVDFEEPVWRTSWMIGLKNAFEQARGGTIPNWDNSDINIPTCYFRGGVIAWETVNPPSIHVRRSDRPSTTVDIPIKYPGHWQWQFRLSDDGSTLVTRNAPDIFQIWTINFPTVKLEQECRLIYDEQADILTLKRIRTAS